MLRFIMKIIVGFAILAVLSATVTAEVQASDIVTDTRLEARSNLRSDLREILSLIPRQRVGFIAARHLILDPNFRTAALYLRGMEFPQTWQQILDATEIEELIAYVRNHTKNANYDVTRVIYKIPNRLRSFRIPEKVPVELMMQRTLSSFLNEVVRALPRARITETVTRKVEENGEFARFYKALRTPNFKELVDKARKSENLVEPLATIGKHSINVDDLIEIGFSVLSWGPKP